jgi:hypothetical protein
VSGEHEPSVILKDNDIKYKIRLPRLTTENLLTQIRADADFLLSIGVMDYSLLGTGAMLFGGECVCVCWKARSICCVGLITEAFELFDLFGTIMRILAI